MEGFFLFIICLLNNFVYICIIINENKDNVFNRKIKTRTQGKA